MECQALVRKRRADGTRDPCNRGHERGAQGVIELANVTEVPPRDHQRMADMKLPLIQKRNSEIVLPDDARSLLAARDPADTHAALIELLPASCTPYEDR
jgi:hypothetical protein